MANKISKVSKNIEIARDKGINSIDWLCASFVKEKEPRMVICNYYFHQTMCQNRSGAYCLIFTQDYDIFKLLSRGDLC